MLDTNLPYPDETPGRERPDPDLLMRELVEAYIRFMTLGAAIQGVIVDHGDTMEVDGRLMLGRLRDAAAAAAERLGGIAHAPS